MFVLNVLSNSCEETMNDNNLIVVEPHGVTTFYLFPAGNVILSPLCFSFPTSLARDRGL